jgi:hypothetical protein
VKRQRPNEGDRLARRFATAAPRLIASSPRAEPGLERLWRRLVQQGAARDHLRASREAESHEQRRSGGQCLRVEQ